MLTGIQRFFGSVIAVILMALGSQAHSTNQVSALKPGDVLTQKGDNGKWHVIRVLEVDTWPDGTKTAHCLSYEDTDSKVKLSSIGSLKVRIWHAPISEESFLSGWELIGNRKISQGELKGFLHYLKITDFPRYAKISGEDVKAIVRKSNEHYLRANALAEKGNRSGAIAEYKLAIDLFPLFYEAIDNLAFTYMELSDYQSALQNFEASLDVNPDGVAAYFSKGECLLKLGRLAEARDIFTKGISKFPEQSEMFSKFLDVANNTK